MVNASRKTFSPLLADTILQIEELFHSTTSSSDSAQERLASIKNASQRGIAQLEIQKEACGRETTTHAILMQLGQRAIDRALW